MNGMHRSLHKWPRGRVRRTPPVRSGRRRGIWTEGLRANRQAVPQAVPAGDQSGRRPDGGRLRIDGIRITRQQAGMARDRWEVVDQVRPRHRHLRRTRPPLSPTARQDRSGDLRSHQLADQALEHAGPVEVDRSDPESGTGRLGTDMVKITDRVLRRSRTGRCSSSCPTS